MKRATAVAAVVACALTGLAGVSAQASGSREAAPVEPSVEPVPPRVAFTRDRSQLHETPVRRFGTPPNDFYSGGTARTVLGVEHGELPTHTGEAATARVGGPGQRTTFVGTPSEAKEEQAVPFGEVYESDGAGTSRITCNAELETHPVPRPVEVYGDGGDDMIAFASDADGDWDIWVAYRAEESDIYGSSPPAEPAAHLPGECDEDVAMVNVTGEAFQGSDELWPAWGPHGELVFSSTRENPLGDLYALYPVQEVETGPEWGSELRLTTTDEVASTQPAVSQLANGLFCSGSDCYSEEDGVLDTCQTDEEGSDAVVEPWIAFTTTAYRPDGSLALMPLPRSPEEEPATPRTAFREEDGTPQSAEPAWSGACDDPYLAFTSTQRDPQGDVMLADVVNPDRDGESDEDPVLRDPSRVAGEPGTAESHPAWVDPFGVEDPDAALVYTSDTPPADALQPPSRITDADLADVRAEDGADPRVVVDRSTEPPEPRRWDEADAAYSPDGASVAYSAALRPFPAECVIEERVSPGLEIPDPPPDEVELNALESADTSIDVDAPGSVRDVDVTVDIPHENTEQLVLELDHDGRSVVLASERGSYYQTPTGYVGTTFDDEADEPLSDDAYSFTGRFRPEQELSTLDFTEAGGEWTLRVTDTTTGGTGVLESWALRIEHCDVPDPVGRELRTATADGSDDASLAEVTAHAELDVDLDPVWSPDGTRVAFVRYRADDSDGLFYEDPRVMVTDLTAGEPNATPLSVDEECTSVSDVSPSWSPDGGWVVVSRASFFSCGSARPARAGLSAARRGEPRQISAARRLTALRADGSGAAADLAVAVPCEEEGGCTETVPGSSPAWSVDGRRIAYEYRGALRLVDVDPAALDEGVRELVVDSATAVTGFRDSGEGEPFDQQGAPTASRPAVSVARDPAWSPDGSEIAFTGQPAGQPDQRGIWAVRPDGDGLRLLTDLDPGDATVDVDARGPDSQPAWQPSPADLAVTVEVVPESVPAGEAAVATYTVQNLGPARDEDVVLTTEVPASGTVEGVGPPGCAPDGSGCVLTGLEPGESVTYVLTLTYPEPLEGTVTGTVHSPTWSGRDTEPGNNTASADLVVLPAELPVADLRVVVELDEPVGYVGGERTATITVDNPGTDPAEEVSLLLSYDLDGLLPTSGDLDCLVDAVVCDLGTVEPGADPLVLEVVIATGGRGTGTVEAELTSTTAEANPADNVATADVEVLQPRVRLLPEVARPGAVVLAYGEDMPPGAQVSLTWDPGITVVRRPHTVAEDGTLRFALLVVRRDRIGERALVASSEDALFSDVEGRMLVTLRTLMAPDFRGRG